MKKTNVVIIASGEVTNVAAIMFIYGDKYHDPNITHIDIDRVYEHVPTEELDSIKNADYIVLQYVREDLTIFARLLSDGLQARNLDDESSIPVFKILYDKRLADEDELFNDLVSATRYTYIRDLLKPHLPNKAEGLLMDSLSQTKAYYVSVSTVDCVEMLPPKSIGGGYTGSNKKDVLL